MWVTKGYFVAEALRKKLLASSLSIRHLSVSIILIHIFSFEEMKVIFMIGRWFREEPTSKC